MSLLAAGVALSIPSGWEVRVRRQPVSEPQQQGNLLLHAATVPLPSERGDFGSGVVTTLGPDDVFVALFEYDGAAVRQPLFAHPGLPRPRPAEFAAGALQRPLPGQSGGQWFFTAADRAWCLHVVLGSHARRMAGCAKVDTLLDGLRIGARR